MADTSSPISGINVNKASSTPNSTDNGTVGQSPQLHVKHDILVWFEVLELGKSEEKYSINIICHF